MNLQVIRKGLKRMGFKSDLDKQIELEAVQGNRKFHVDFTESFDSLNSKIPVDFQMFFKLHDKTEMFFPISYKATLKNSPERTQIFRVDENMQIEAQEAFNLLDGRAIRKLIDKDGMPYAAWFQLDFNTKDVHGNFLFQEFRKEAGKLNLATDLIHTNIKEFQSWDERVNMVKSLCHGNILQVTLMRHGEEFPVLVQASPKGRETEFFDLNRKSLPQSEATTPNQKKTTPDKVPRQRLKVRGL